MRSKVFCEARMASWVEPVLRDMAMLHQVGFISTDSFDKIIHLLVQDGVEIGPMRVVDE